MALGLALVPACTSMASLHSVSPNSIGTTLQVVPGTVVSARPVTIGNTEENKARGEIVGAAVGAGAGQLLGRGKGRVASTVGFGILGAAIGHAVAANSGTHGQELIIRADGSRRTYSVVQPVYRECGAIPVGTHGYLRKGNRGSMFLPDGY